ncbi:MAG: TetR/AcrR family transcriptional regulator [Chitinivibrionia bacterium]|nr:TetR/AcrR family transcriptional regulator [Chitinivibrionia bacterium]
MNTKERIIAATIELIKKSVENTTNISTRSITQKVGISVAVVNYHFQNKERLFDICLERMLCDVLKTFNLSEHNHLDMQKHKLKTVFDFLSKYSAVARISTLVNFTKIFFEYNLDNKEQRDAILDLLVDSLFGNTEPKPEIRQEKKGNENSQK